MSSGWSSNNNNNKEKVLLSPLANFNFNSVSNEKSIPSVVLFSQEEDSSDSSQDISSDTICVPNSDFVAEIIGKQGCKIKRLRAKTNTFVNIFNNYLFLSN